MSFSQTYDLEFLLFLRHLKISLTPMPYSIMAWMHQNWLVVTPSSGHVPLGAPTPPAIPLSSQLWATCYWACAVLFPIVWSISWHVCLSKVGNHKIILRGFYMFHEEWKPVKVFLWKDGNNSPKWLFGACWLHSFMLTTWLLWAFEWLWKLIIMGSIKCLFPVCLVLASQSL